MTATFKIYAAVFEIPVFVILDLNLKYTLRLNFTELHNINCEINLNS